MNKESQINTILNQMSDEISEVGPKLPSRARHVATNLIYRNYRPRLASLGFVLTADGFPLLQYDCFGDLLCDRRPRQ